MGPFAWIGARAQWVLAAGVVTAMLVPGPGEVLRGTIPFWVGFLLMLAMARIDMGTVLRAAIRPRRLGRTLAFLAVLMCVTPALFLVAARTAGLPAGLVEALVYTATAPPFGSAAALCLIMGLNAAFALELTILGAFAAPLVMPVMARLLLGEVVPIDAAEMVLRLAILIGASAAGAVMLRRILGPRRIQRHARSLDGLGVVCLIVFLFPVFDATEGQVFETPALALLVLVTAVVANLGVQIAAWFALRRSLGRGTGGAAALIWGNRNAALTLAVLPPDPVLALYVALYQFPMYVTPLVMQTFVGRPAEATAR